MKYRIESTGFVWLVYIKVPDGHWCLHDSYSDLDEAKMAAGKLASDLGLSCEEVQSE